ncbi:MAG: threonine synthase, partial [Chloroflexota bacterium]|nr:threonine synthase [Chloroflexota bacterium]
DEGLNPTGTFKARGLSVAVSKAKELGIRRVAMPSAGNAAGALAAYAARAGIEARVFMPKDAPAANRIECQALGAKLTLVDGHIGDAGRLSRQAAASEGLFDMSTLQEPYRVEGKKSMALELAVEMGWQMPDAIIYPTGGGTGIIGMHKAFQEMLSLGWAEGPLPRFIAVQASGCQPIVKAFHAGAVRAEPWPDPQTVAQGLKVPGPFADYLILKVLRETGGTALAVEDAEMLVAVREMASLEGVFACPEGAATLAGLRVLLDQRFFRGDERIVLLNTGTAYKYLDALAEG